MKHWPLLFLFLPFWVNGQGTLDGFVQEKGKVDLAFSLTYQKAPEYFAGRDPIDYEREHYIASLFASYGITERFDINLNIPFIKGRYLDGVGNFQDGELLLGYQCFRGTAAHLGKLSLTLGAGGRYPLSDYETETGQAIGQQAQTLVGRAVFQVNPQSPFFIEFRGGYDASSEPVPSTYLYSSKIGFSFEKFYAELFYEKQNALGGKDYRGSGKLAADSFRELGVAYHRTGISIYRPLGLKWGISVASSYIPSGRNTGKNITLSTGIVYRYRQPE